MSTYLEFINKLRVELKDFGKIHRDVFDGDSSTTLFLLAHIPIKDGSYTVKIGGAGKEETTDYSIDKDTGVVSTVSAPTTGSDNIEVTYKSVKIRDEDYLDILNDGIERYRWKFWEEEDDLTTLTSVKDQYEYDCSGITDILYILNAWIKSSSSSTIWQDIQGSTNWEYRMRQQKLYVNPPLASSSMPIKIRYLKQFTKATETSGTFPIPTKWQLPFKYYAYARYYERLIVEKIHETAAVTTQPSFSPAQVVANLAEYFYKKADEVATRIAPRLPNLSIKNIHQGITF